MIDRLASLPPGGGRVWYFPGPADHGHADIVARVQRRDGSSWIACLARLEPGLGHGIFALPCGPRWSATLGSDAAVTAVTNDRIVCDVYDWAAGAPVTRRYDLLTGQPR